MKKVKCVLLAGYVLCWLVLFLVDGLLLIGQVSSWDIMGALFWIGLLALIAWGDMAIVRFTEHWNKWIMLSIALIVEGLLLFIIWFFSFYFNTGPEFIPLYGPSGEVELVVCEESWLFKVWGKFYRPSGPFLIRSTGVTYDAHDSWPFHGGRYELEWGEDQVVVRYDAGAGWDSCTVPLD